jgi:hypothetical protein
MTPPAAPLRVAFRRPIATVVGGTPQAMNNAATNTVNWTLTRIVVIVHDR